MTLQPKNIVILVLCISVMIVGFAAIGPESFSSTEVSWIAPEDGDDVYGIVKLTIVVSGNDFSGVRFYHDLIDDDHFIGAGIQEGDLRYTGDWYTQDIQNGQHMLHVVADLVSGEKLQSAVTVDVGNMTRADSIPMNAEKMTPANDPAPPRLSPTFKDYWHDPVPLEGPINTAGAEDSAFITPDGNTLYFWFKGDITKSVHEELRDPMGGIYWSKKVDGHWQEPERLYLRYYDEISLDGAQTVWNDELWFVSIRSGNYKDMDFWIAQLVDGRWTNWKNAGEELNKEIIIGEMHITADGNEIYFDSSRDGGKGQKDIWVTRKLDGQWQEPENIDIVNTELTEGWPFISQDGNELWFTRANPGPTIFRSVKVDGQWQEPEMVIHPLAGESTLDNEGNIYFTHHWWDNKNNRVKEADIYVCYHK